MPAASQVFFILFLMLGPFKVLGPFTKMTLGATPALTRNIAIRAILLASIILILAAVMGDQMLENFGIPVPVLALAGGVILFMVALMNVLQQFDTPKILNEPVAPPSMKVAMNPLAFPTIVTPYGVAAVIVFMALAPDMDGKMLVGEIILIIMAINLVFMLINRYIFKVMAVILPILGAILGVVQVALGLKIIYNSIDALLRM
jgi:multiple antibiotic resistance protein